MTALQTANAKIRDLRTVIVNMRAKYEGGYARLEETVAVLQKEVMRLTEKNAELRDENTELAKKAKAADGIPALKETVKELGLALSEKQKEFEKATDTMKTPRKRLGADCASSDRPQSTNIFKKPVSTRKRSGRTVGGQKGHKGHALRPFPDPTERIDIMPHDFC